MSRIREVDGSDDEISDTMRELHSLTFLNCAPVPKFDVGHWWLAYRERIQWVSPAWCSQPTLQTPDISAGSECCEHTMATPSSCG
jgi:hypothetical protein